MFDDFPLMMQMRIMLSPLNVRNVRTKNSKSEIHKGKNCRFDDSKLLAYSNSLHKITKNQSSNE